MIALPDAAVTVAPLSSEMTPLGIHLDRAPGLADTLRDAFVMDLSTDREWKDTFLARLGTTDLKKVQLTMYSARQAGTSFTRTNTALFKGNTRLYSRAILAST